MIVDSDYSGTFADDLGATAGRVVLTSTGETAFTGQNLRTGSIYNSYSYMLFSSISSGDSGRRASVRGGRSSCRDLQPISSG